MVAKPLPGCSRRCSRVRRCRTRLPGRYRAGRNAHRNATANRSRTASAMAYLMIIAGLRSGRPARRGAARPAPIRRSGSTWGARAAEVFATASSGMAASGPCRSVTRARNRAVLVPPRGPLPRGATAAAFGLGDGRGGRGRGGRRGGRGRPGIPPAPRCGTRAAWTPGPCSGAAATAAALRPWPAGWLPRRPARRLVRSGGRSPRPGRRRSACRWPARRRPGASSRPPGPASPARPRSRS